MKQDRFLIGILIFIGLLVIVAVALFLVHSKAPAYGPDNSPQGVVYNYAVALQLDDYTRAYGYLAEKDNKPTYDDFRQAFLSRQLDISTSALQIGEVLALDSGEAWGSAWVSVTVQYAGNGIFDSGYSSTDKASLVLQKGVWKITYLPYPYWGWDWYQPTPAPVKQ